MVSPEFPLISRESVWFRRTRLTAILRHRESESIRADVPKTRCRYTACPKCMQKVTLESRWNNDIAEVLVADKVPQKVVMEDPEPPGDCEEALLRFSSRKLDFQVYRTEELGAVLTKCERVVVKLLNMWRCHS